MTTQLKLKKSSVVGKVPLSSDLDYGELAINYADGIIYYKNSSNQIKSFVDSDLIVSSITGTVDSAYVLNLIGGAASGLDSADVISLVDSAYVYARQTIDSAFVRSEVNTYVDSAYIGDLLGTIDKLDEITTTDSTTYQLLLNTASYSPPNATSILVSVNGIIQEAGDAYTVNSDTITFAQPLSANSDTIDFILTIGKPYSTTEHIQGVVNSIVDSDYIAAIIGQPKLLDQITTTDSTTYSLSYSSTPYISLSDAALLVSVNGIIQEAGTAYTVDSDKITFAQPLSANSDTIDFILSLAFPYTVPDVLDGSITSAKLGTGITVYDSSHVMAIIDSSRGNITTDLIPSVDSALDLGSPTKKWKDLYLSGSTIYLGKWAMKETPTGMILVDSVGAHHPVAVSEQALSTSDSVTFAGLTVSGDLIVNGTTTTVNSEIINLADNIIVLNSNETGTPSQDAGIDVERGTSNNVSILWNETDDVWKFTNDGSNYHVVKTTANIDSDFDARLAIKTTDNLTEGSNLYYTTARADSDFDVRLAIKSTADLTEGANLYYTATRVDSDIDSRVTKSFVDALNVDADTLDGQEGTYYLDYTNFTNKPFILDSTNVLGIVTANSLDSSETISIVDSAYVQARQITYANLSEFVNDTNYLDSSTATSFIDSAYINSRISQVDSAAVLAIVDSDYVAINSYTPTVYKPSTTYAVTVATKTSGHIYNGQGSNDGYFIDGRESPFIELIPGQTYVFDQSDASNVGHPLRFYYDASKTTQYTSGVTVAGTAGSAGASTTIVVSESTPSHLYYQCSVHGLMGWSVGVHTHNITGLLDSVKAIIDSDYLYATLTGGTGVTVDTVNNQIKIGQAVGTTDNVTFNNLILNGNLTVRGTTTSVETETIKLADNIIELNSNQDSVTLPSENAGLVVNRGSVSDTEFRWNETSDQWEIAVLDSNAATPVYHRIITAADSGSFDAGTLNGQPASYYTNYTNLTSAPQSILDFGINDGTSGQVLQTDGAGNFTFTTVSGGGGSATGYAGYEDYYYNITGTQSSFGTSTGAHDKVQVFRNGVLQDDSLYTFNDSTGIVTLTTAADSGDEVTIWGFNSTNLDNHELISVDSSGNTDIIGTVKIGAHNLNGSLNTTFASGAAQNILLYSTADYIGAKLVITVKDNITSHSQITEALILTVDSDGSGGNEPVITTYGTIFSGASALASFDVTKSAGDSDTRLEVTTPSGNSSTVKVVYSLITI